MAGSADGRGKAEGKPLVRLEGGGQAARTSGDTVRMRLASSTLPNICCCADEHHWRPETPTCLITAHTLEYFWTLEVGH